MDKKKSLLIIIAGPTAVGKTDLSIELAKEYKSSIFSCDSRQFYKELNIGTAKPSLNELSEVNHFFINNKSITEPYSAGDYEKELIAELKEYFKINKIAFLVGGSGMYIDAVCKGLDHLPKNKDVRSKLNLDFKEYGIKHIQEQLYKLDPSHYNKIDILNPQRIIRALEVCIISGKPYSTFLSNSPKKRNFKTLKFLLHLDQDQLIENINVRVDRMIENGLIEEVKNLSSKKHLNSLNTVGYKEVFEYLRGEINKETAINQIKINTKKYAKRQMTWFKKDPDFIWMKNNMKENPLDRIKNKINQFIYD